MEDDTHTDKSYSLSVNNSTEFSTLTLLIHTINKSIDSTVDLTTEGNCLLRPVWGEKSTRRVHQSF